MRVDVATSIDEVFKLNSEIQHFLSTHFELEVDSDILEMLIKIAVVFHECIQIYSEKYIDNNFESNKTFSGCYTKKYFNEAMTSSSFTLLTDHILRSQGVLKKTVIFDNILKSLKNFSMNKSFEAFTPNDSYFNLNRKKMHFIIERVFVLPYTDIELAIEKLIMNVDFLVLGHVFCESVNSIYFDKCTIIVDKICNNIKNSKKCITDFFIPSLLSSVSNSNTGLLLYKKCLKNKAFSGSLYVYLNINLTIFNTFLYSNPSRISNFSNHFLLYMFYIIFKKENGFANICKNVEFNLYTILSDYLSFVNVLFT